MVETEMQTSVSLSLTPSGIQTARNTPRRPKRNIFESARCGKPSLSRIH